MSIDFNDIADSVRASKNFIELAGVRRSVASLFIPPTIGIIGQYDVLKTSVVDYTPVKITSKNDGGSQFGFGSHIHRQLLRLPNAVFLQGGGVYVFPVPEDVAAASAAELITFTGTATSAGTLYFRIGGELVQVAVSIDDAAADVASTLEDEITAVRDIAVTASASGAITTLTAKFGGTAGNQILVRLNPSGDSQEDDNPVGITVALGETDGYLTGGATDPSVESCFFDDEGNDKLGDTWYTGFTAPFSDATNLAFHALMGDTRNDPSNQRLTYSAVGYVKETYAEALALPETINNEYVTAIWENRYDNPAFELAAALVGTVADEQNSAPNRPYKTLEVSGTFDNSVSNRLYAENDALFIAGMSFCKLNSLGTELQFGDIALSYRTDDYGGDTEEWFDLVSLSGRQAKAYSIEQVFLADKYQRGVVVDNDSPTNVSYAIAPKDVVAEMTKLIEDLWSPYAWSKNIDTIIANLTAEINTSNESRIDSEVIDDEAKALRIIASRYAFYY